MPVFAAPFRFTGSGRVATVDPNSDAGVLQGIAVMLQSRRGERRLVPDFGITDPVWSDVDLDEVNAGLRRFGPDAELVKLAAEWPTPTTRRFVAEVRR